MLNSFVQWSGQRGEEQRTDAGVKGGQRGGEQRMDRRWREGAGCEGVECDRKR